MSRGDRRIMVILVVVVIALAVWKGGLVLLLGVVVAGVAWRLLDFLAERDYRARHKEDNRDSCEPRSLKRD
jgi:hypothetical protein